MSVCIIYRNNFFYYLFMFLLWFFGVLIYLGLGWIYVFYLVVKFIVIIGVYVEWKWDKILYSIWWLYFVVWVIECMILMFFIYSVYYGLKVDDGVINYKGNYGNLLFFWDVLFGIVKIIR